MSIIRIIIVCAIVKNTKTNVIIKVTKKMTTIKKINNAIIIKKQQKLELSIILLLTF